ncbi:hypothetical protein BHM03_00030785, partial [Ensete ventricosum]
IKAFQALEVMKSCHDFDSTFSVESLVMVRKHYSIPDEYALHAPSPKQCSYDAYPEGFSISVDAFKAGLRFPLHPVVGAMKAGGLPGSASRAPVPIAPIVQLSSDIEEVRVEVVSKESVEPSGKQPIIGGAHLRKKMKVSDHHKSQREGEGSKFHPSKGKEHIGAIGKLRLLDPVA